MKQLIWLLTAVSLVGAVRAEAEIEDLCVKPGSARGSIAVLNRQTLVPESVFVEAAQVVREHSRFIFKFGTDAAVLKTATVRLTLVDEPSDPAPMTVSPEVGRGTLNVAALTNGLSAATLHGKTLTHRAKLEFLRLVCYSLGIGGSRFDGNLMSATTLGELDKMDPFLPVDIPDRLEKSAAKRGLKPEIVAYYDEACQAGWAPAPTNAAQKAVWDKVHALPTNPITIKPELKPVKK